MVLTEEKKNNQNNNEMYNQVSYEINIPTGTYLKFFGKMINENILKASTQ